MKIVPFADEFFHANRETETTNLISELISWTHQKLVNFFSAVYRCCIYVPIYTSIWRTFVFSHIIAN